MWVLNQYKVIVKIHQNMLSVGTTANGEPTYEQTDENKEAQKHKQEKAIMEVKYRYKDFMPLVDNPDYYTNKIIDLCMLTKDAGISRNICKVEIAKMVYLKYINEDILHQIKKYYNVCVTFLQQHERLNRLQIFNTCSAVVDNFGKTMMLYIRDQEYQKWQNSTPVCSKGITDNCRIYKKPDKLPLCSDKNNFTNCTLK